MARTPDELKEATKKGFEARVPVVVNVIVDPQADLEMVSIISLLTIVRLLIHNRIFLGSIWLHLLKRKRSRRSRSCDGIYKPSFSIGWKPKEIPTTIGRR